MFDTTMFDLEADGSGEDRCDACGSGPHYCWMYLQMRVACCERCSHRHDAALAREVCYEWEEFLRTAASVASAKRGGSGEIAAHARTVVTGANGGLLVARAGDEPDG
jgi:hypothetical protein